MEKTIYDNNTMYARLVDTFSRLPGKKHEIRQITSLLQQQRAKKILDFGCNTGYVASIIKKRTGAEVYGTDINPYALETGKKKYADVRFLSLAAAKTMKGAFDAIIVSQVLEHVPDVHETLSLLKRLLSPAGKIVISVPQERIRGDCNIPHIILSSVQNKKYTNPHVRAIRRKDLSSLLDREGMEIEAYTYVNFLPPFVSKRRIWPVVWALVALCKRK